MLGLMSGNGFDEKCHTWALPMILAISWAGPAMAGTGVVVESVSDYGDQPHCSEPGYPLCINLPGANPNGNGFMSAITTGGFFTNLHRYPDSSVYDSDFVDPEYNSSGNDTYNFDQSGTAISYLAAHGTCNSSPTPYQYCTSNAQCTQPPSGFRQENGSCVFVASQSWGVCHYVAPRYLVTHSPYDTLGSWINYNNYWGNVVAWGESANSGAWRSAGTNGGTNLVVLDISCGAYVSSILPDLGPAIAGAHMIATVMPTGGDTAMVSDRGSTFAQAFVQNSNSSVSAAWVNLANGSAAYPYTALPSNDTPFACDADGQIRGRGINGCGGYVVLTVGATGTEAANHMAETWVDIQNDSKDTTGISYWTSSQMFNYDTVAYPPLH